MARQDPFYVLKVEIEESVSASKQNLSRSGSWSDPSLYSWPQVHDLKQKMTRYHGLQAKNPERKTLSSQVEAGCQSIRWQVCAVSEANPLQIGISDGRDMSALAWQT